MSEVLVCAKTESFLLQFTANNPSTKKEKVSEKAHGLDYYIVFDKEKRKEPMTQ